LWRKWFHVIYPPYAFCCGVVLEFDPSDKPAMPLENPSPGGP
jgi:hypothetical protein